MRNMEYRKLYIFLFNKITDAIEQMDAGKPASAREVLVEAQREAEELYISRAEEA